MRDTLHLYLRYISASVRSQLQYRASFVLMTLAHLGMTGVEFVAIWALFDRFGSVRGWALPEVALFYGIANVAFAIADAVSRGFDMFGNTVKSGEFDRLLLRPCHTALQLAGQELTLRRIGRLTQGLLVLLWGSATVGIAWSPAKFGLVVFAIVGGACLFTGLLVLQATLAFWTTETLEIVNTVTYGGVQTAQYPLTIYEPWFRRFFTFVVPLATMNYFPMLAILGRADPLGTPCLFHWLTPGIGILFLLATLRIWEIGVRHYRSTGS